MLVVCFPALAQQRSAKRGVCWDEKSQTLTTAPIEKMAPGVAWLYNWGEAPNGTPDNLGPDKAMGFIPMCWNAGFNETKLRSYLTAHPGVEVLLGFNEPNFSAQANMTPQAAATAWKKLEQIATEFNLKLAAPALNFTDQYVGGKIWSPYEWLDEFFRLYPTAQVDYLALHCYMNWYSSNTWFATEYFYKDLYDSSKTGVYGKYPYLVKYLNAYKTANGHFPQMYLTEFCAWEGDKDGYTSSVDSQIDQMTQKVQKLEQSDLVAGYAWFMANPSQAPTEYPYMSMFQSKTASSELSDLGKVYVYMSSFDTEKYYTPGETILAKDYIDASTDSYQAKVRPNTETGSDIPLQVECKQYTWAGYQIEVPAAGDYTLTLHVKSSAESTFRLYCDGRSGSNVLQDIAVPSTSGAWTDVTQQVTLKAGKHTLYLYNRTNSSVFVNSLRFETTTGIEDIKYKSDTDSQYYDLSGRRVARPTRGIYIVNGHKVVVR